jgi:hypothetical protein
MKRLDILGSVVLLTIVGTLQLIAQEQWWDRSGDDDIYNRNRQRVLVGRAEQPVWAKFQVYDESEERIGAMSVWGDRGAHYKFGEHFGLSFFPEIPDILSAGIGFKEIYIGDEQRGGTATNLITTGTLTVNGKEPSTFASSLNVYDGLTVNGTGTFGSLNSNGGLAVNGGGDFGGNLVIRGSSSSSFIGNLGVGIQNPTQKFEVSGNSKFSGRIGIGGNPSSDPFTPLLLLGSTTVRVNLQSSLSSLQIAADEIGGSLWSEYSLTFATGSGIHPILFKPMGAEAMRIDASGDVGIGTTSPSEKLELVGNMLLSGNADRRISVASSEAESYKLTIEAGSTTDQLGGGLVGGDLYLKGGNAPNNAGGNVYVYPGGTTAFGNVILAHDGSVTRGNVGIGTTSPTKKLQVAGVALFDTALQVKTPNKYKAYTFQTQNTIINPVITFPAAATATVAYVDAEFHKHRKSHGKLWNVRRQCCYWYVITLEYPHSEGRYHGIGSK